MSDEELKIINPGGMMNEPIGPTGEGCDPIASALQELSYLAICASLDFHMLHFQVRGKNFDSLHKAMKKYYEEAADDYDEFGEQARMFGAELVSATHAAELVQWKSMQIPSGDTQGIVVGAANLMDEILEQYTTVWKVLNKKDDCPKAIGIANFLQGRIEYWSKERFYFNESRGGMNETI